MTCHAGGGWGGGRSWSLSSARTLTLAHTLRQTAAARAPPPLPGRLPAETPALPPTQPQHPQPTPQPHLWQRDGPLPHQVSSPKKEEKQVNCLQWDCGVRRREKQGFPPGLKRGSTRCKPCSCQSQPESTWLRGRVLRQGKYWDQRSLVVISQSRGLQGMVDWGRRVVDRKQIHPYPRSFSFWPS